MHAAACGAGSLSLAQALAQLSSSTLGMDSLDTEGWSALHRAAWNGIATSVSMLLKAKANVSVRTGDSRNTTPLHYASGMGHLECVQMLLDGGADPHAKDAEGWTPLVVAQRTAKDQAFKNQNGLVPSSTWETIYKKLQQQGGTPPMVAFFDCHFHLWDLTSRATSPTTTSGHDSSILFAPRGNPNYNACVYEAEFQNSVCCEHIGGVYLEAMSVCFPSMKGTELNALCVKEAEWAIVALQQAPVQKMYSVVASACLEVENVGDTLASLNTLGTAPGAPSVVGIRQIVNKDPSWPRNKDQDDLLTNEAWRRGYALLATYALSFDLQCNPSQFETAAMFFSQHPNTSVIINHAGCFTKEDLETDMAWEGLTQLAALPHVYIKISMLCYAFQDWDVSGKGREEIFLHVQRIIELFTCDRCMFASNYPVDIKDLWPAARLLPTFMEVVREQGYSSTEVKKMFSTNSMVVYKAGAGE